VEHIGKLISRSPAKKERATERGELMEYFRDRLNPDRIKDGIPPLSMPRMAKVLQLIPTKDLYYLKTVCEQSKHFSKKFWWEINPKKHQEKQEEKKPIKKLLPKEKTSYDDY